MFVVFATLGFCLLIAIFAYLRLVQVPNSNRSGKSDQRMAATQKCVHKGCGKVFTDPDEPCVYHPGPPEFHEGQKGWKCCKPRVLTFDEFLEIPPCTTGKHSIVDENADKAEEEKKQAQKRAEENMPKRLPIPEPKTAINGTATPTPASSLSTTLPQPGAAPSPAPSELEEDSDDPSTPIPDNTTCKRRTCGKSSKDFTSPDAPRKDECTFHPGIPIFHEGSKGWTCCKRRVLEFDEFMKIGGCKTRTGHCFVGKRSKGQQDEEILQDVRNDFYQTAGTLIVSFYLKKINKEKAIVEFKSDGSGLRLDLPTADGKRFTTDFETWRDIDPDKSKFKVLGSKLEMTLVKKEGGLGWPVLRRTDRDYGERIQVGRAGVA